MKTINLIFVLVFSSFMFCGNALGFIIGDSSKISASSISLSGHYGFLLPHHNEISYVNQKNVSSLELTYKRNFAKNKEWTKRFNSPSFGCSLYYFSLSSKDYLGNGIGLVPRAFFPLGSKKRFDFHFGLGLGYVQKPFDLITNNKNLVIGSQLNSLLITGVNYHITQGEKIQIFAGIDLTHFSNGSLQLPNLGINNLTASLGLRVNLDQEIKSSKVKNSSLQVNKWFHLISLSGGLKSVDVIKNRKFGIGVLNWDRLIPKSEKLIIGHGVNLSYRGHNTFNKASRDTGYVNNNWDNVTVSGHGSIGLQLGANLFMFQMGLHVISKDNPKGRIYHKIVSRWKLSESVYANFSLNTNFAIADFFEAGIGIKL